MARTLVPGLTRENVGSEALAGVTLLAIAVPLNIGYAQIAGLPPTAGLYALVLPAVLYALTVSSRQLVASPDAAAAALVASSIGGGGWPRRGASPTRRSPWPRRSSAASSSSRSGC